MQPESQCPTWGWLVLMYTVSCHLVFLWCGVHTQAGFELTSVLVFPSASTVDLYQSVS